MEQRYEVIRLFRELGVSINQYDLIKQTPLHYAANYLSEADEKSLNEKIILELLKFDDAMALLTAEDKYKMTPIKCANDSHNSNFFKALKTLKTF